MPFVGRLKFSIFKKFLKNPMSCDLLSSVQSEHDEEQLVDFILSIVYSKPHKEKVPGDSRNSMLFCANGKSKKSTPTKKLLSDIKSLRMRFKQANLVPHSIVNCLNIRYESKKSTPTKKLLSDIKSLRMRFKQANLVPHSIVNCLNIRYEQLDPTAYGWERKGEGLHTKWFDGNALPTEQGPSEILQASDNDDILSYDDV